MAQTATNPKTGEQVILVEGQWKPFSEDEFQRTYGFLSREMGLDPNPDAPEHMYDYRTALASGKADPMNPEHDGHWPSQFKAPEHPNRYVDGVDTISGEPAKTATNPETGEKVYLHEGVKQWLPMEVKPEGGFKASMKDIGLSATTEPMKDFINTAIAATETRQRGKFTFSDPNEEALFNRTVRNDEARYGRKLTETELDTLRKQYQSVPPEAAQEQMQQWEGVLKKSKEALPDLPERERSKFTQAVMGFARFAPSMVATAASGGAGAGVTLSQLYGAKYGEYRDKGIDPEQADAAAFVTAAMSTPVEYAGNVFQLKLLKPLAKSFGLSTKASGKAIDFMTKARKTTAGKIAAGGGRVTAGGVAEGAEEGIQAYAEAAGDILAENPDAKPKELLDKFKAHIQTPEFIEQRNKSAELGFIGGVTLGGAGQTIAAVSGRKEQKAEPAPPVQEEIRESLLNDLVQGATTTEELTALKNEVSPEQSEIIDAALADYESGRPNMQGIQTEQPAPEVQPDTTQGQAAEVAPNAPSQTTTPPDVSAQDARSAREISKEARARGEKTMGTLAAEVQEYSGTGGISSENRKRGFRPAFRHSETGEVFPSIDESGREAGVHMLEGIPDQYITERDPEYGDVLAVSPQIESGFIRNGKFYTRQEATALPTPADPGGAETTISERRSKPRGTPDRRQDTTTRKHSETTKQFNTQHPGSSLKYDGAQDRTAINKPPLHSFTAYAGPAKGATFSLENPTIESIRAKLDEMVDLRNQHEAKSKDYAALKQKAADAGISAKDIKRAEGEVRGAVEAESKAEKAQSAPKGSSPQKITPAKSKRPTGPQTLRGRIKQAGGISFLNFKGEKKNMPVEVKWLAKNNGTPIDLLERTLKDEGWLDQNETLLDILPQGKSTLKRGKVVGTGGEARTDFQREQEREFEESANYEPDEPPPGDYVTVKAEDLPEGSELTILDGNGRDGWDEYKVIEKDPFGVTLQDGTIVELSPLDKVQVRKQDLPRDFSEAKQAEIGVDEPLFGAPERQKAPKAKRTKSKSDQEQKDMFGYNQSDMFGSRAGTARTKQTDTPAFKKWFGKSKVVDSDGKPLVVYHGTLSDFKEFKGFSVGKNTDAVDTRQGEAYFFSDKTDLPNMFGSMHGGNVMPVMLSVQNPLVWDLPKHSPSLIADVIKDAKEKGHDGAIIPITERFKKNGRSPGLIDTGTVYIAFSPTQIKSAIGNTGKFDPNNPDITDAVSRLKSALKSERGSWSFDQADHPISQDLVTVGRHLYSEGADNVKKFAKAMRDKIGEAWDKISKHIQAIFDAAKKAVSNERGQVSVEGAGKKADLKAKYFGTPQKKKPTPTPSKKTKKGYAETLKPITEQDYIDNRNTRKSVRKTAIRNARAVLSEIAEGTDAFLGSISTRLGNVSPKLKFKMRRLDSDIAKSAAMDIKAVEPMLRKVKKKMTRNDVADWDYARKNSDVDKIKELVGRYGLEKEYAAYRKVLDSIRREAIDVGLAIGEIEEYAPRVLKDSKGFLRAIEKGDDWPVFTRKLKDRAEALGIPVSDMTRDMKADLISNMIATGNYGLSGLPATKRRKLQKIPAYLNQYYMDSDSALVSHIYTMRKGIEARKFFGRVPARVADIKKKLHITQQKLRETDKALKNPSLTTAEKEKLTSRKNKYFGLTQQYWAYLDKYANQRDYRENIGSYVLELIEAGDIKSTQERIVGQILNARFHEKGTHGVIQAYKNLSYIDTMGSPASALTQIGDLAWAVYDSGLIKAVKNASKALTGKSKITKEDVGIERVAQEFSDPGKLSSAVSWVFKAIGLEKMDSIGKEALLNGALEKYQKQARKNPTQLRTQIRVIFENETDGVIDDLKRGDITDNVKLLVYNRLLDFQPVALSEMPQKYLSSGNGRVFYMLKTFTIKQFDVFRNESYNKIKNGNRAEKIQGITNGMRLAMFFVLANAGADELKDLILGRKTDLSDRMVDNALRLFGVSKFVTWKARTEGVGSAMAKQVLPPFKFIDAASKDIYRAGDGKGLEVASSVPLVGKLYYWHMGAGKNKRGDLWDRRFGNAKRKLKKVRSGLERSKSRGEYVKKHRRTLAAHHYIKRVEGGLKKNRSLINKLKGLKETPSTKKRIQKLEEVRVKMIKKHLEQIKKIKANKKAK